MVLSFTGAAKAWPQGTNTSLAVGQVVTSSVMASIQVGSVSRAIPF
jgi:hypothetical protein